MSSPISSSITLAPSRWVTMFIIALYSLVSYVIVLLQTTLMYKLALVIVVMISLVWQWRKMHRCRVMRLFPETSEKPWVLVNKAGEQQDATLLKSLVYRYLVILYFQLENGDRCSLLIPSDSVDKSSHRRLRAVLQLHKSAGKIERISR